MARAKPRPPAETDADVIAALTKKSMTAVAVGKALRMRPSTTRLSLIRLRAAGRLHIGQWVLAPGAKKASGVYRAGPGEDMPYPVGIARKPRAKRVRPPRAAPTPPQDLEEKDNWVPKRKCDHPVIIRRDPLIAALFGEYQGARA